MKKLIAASAILLPAITLAHPGHGAINDGLAHYLLSPIHLIGVAAGIALVAVLYRYYKTSRQQNA